MNYRVYTPKKRREYQIIIMSNFGKSVSIEMAKIIYRERRSYLSFLCQSSLNSFRTLQIYPIWPHMLLLTFYLIIFDRQQSSLTYIFKSNFLDVLNYIQNHTRLCFSSLTLFRIFFFWVNFLKSWISNKNQIKALL